jgi:hypothetical protein
MELYINQYGKPIIPKCGNCAKWQKIDVENKKNVTGYCKALRLFFAYTQKENLYAITKEFYWCKNHEHLKTILDNTKTKEYNSIEDAVQETKAN